MLRNKLRYMLLLAVTGLLAILYDVYYTGIIFLTVALIPFFLFGLLSFCYGQIKAELISDVHVANKGEDIPVTIQLSNPTIFPIPYMKIYLSYRNCFSAQKLSRTLIVPLDYRTSTSVICNLSSQYSGNLEITLDAIKLYDYAKLFSLKRKLHSEIKAAVLPGYYELQESDLLSKNTQLVESDYYSPVKKGDDPSEVFEIREYREGDRLTRIHWKLSSKLNQLMIKEFSFPINCSILLFLNLNIPEGEEVLPYMDAILECALSISYTLAMKGQQHYFAWYDRKQGLVRRLRVAKESDLFEAVDGLLQVQPGSDMTDVPSAYLAEYPHEQYTELFYISGELPEAQTSSLPAIKAQNRQIIYMNNLKSKDAIQDISEELLREYGEAGIDLWPLNIGDVKGGMEQFSLG